MRLLKLYALLLAVVLGCVSVARVAAQDENPQQGQPSENNNSTDKGQQQSTLSPSSDSVTAYRLDFTITEFDDQKKINTRSYSLVAQVGDHPLNKLRIGGRIPVRVGSSSSNTMAQWQYFDIGMNIDCSVREKDGAVLLNATIENSSMAPQMEETTHQPIVRQMKSEVRTVLSPGKPTLIVSLDDPTTKGKFQAEVVATKMH